MAHPARQLNNHAVASAYERERGKLAAAGQGDVSLTVARRLGEYSAGATLIAYAITYL